MQKIIIISGFETYSERVYYLKKYFSKNYEVKVILSDFRHVTKDRIDTNLNAVEDTIFIKTKKYEKNISISRIASHFQFAKSVYNILKDEEVDIIYSLIPPNFLAYFLNKIALDKPKTKVIFDIIDLWPETFPLQKFKRNPFFYLWKKIRNNNLENIDSLVTECDLFISKIPPEMHHKTKTLYLTRRDDQVNWQFTGGDIATNIDICYLGSINNIINLDFIVGLCKEINDVKSVTLHIIGDGEKLSELIQKLEKAQIKYKMYGKVYEPKEKEKIFNTCHFALNVMKKDVFVGLTMKSIDYFEYGVPLINTIYGDTADIIDNYNCGLNYSYEIDNLKKISKRILEVDKENFFKMKNQSRKVFEDLFTENHFNTKLTEIIDSLYY